MNLLKIMEGWRNHIVPPEQLKDIIEEAQTERLSICQTCEFNSKNAGGMRVTPICTICKCILTMKTACLSCDCPKDKWNAIDVKTEENDKSETNID